MKKAVLLSQRIINEINGFQEKYVTDNGELVRSKDAISNLNNIIEDGLVLYKYLCDKKLYEQDKTLASSIIELEKYITKLQVNEKNAKKLNLTNAIQLWTQTKIIIAMIACRILDIKEANSEQNEVE